MKNETTILIGQRINSALAKANKMQKDLALHLGVTDNTVSYYCSGSRTPNTMQIIEIANFLNVSADYLLGLSETSLSIGDKIYWANIPEDNSSIKDASIEEQIVYEIGAKGFWSSPIDYDCDIGNDHNHYADIGKIFFHTPKEAQEAIINKIKTLIGIGLIQTEEEE